MSPSSKSAALTASLALASTRPPAPLLAWPLLPRPPPLSAHAEPRTPPSAPFAVVAASAASIAFICPCAAAAPSTATLSATISATGSSTST